MCRPDRVCRFKIRKRVISLLLVSSIVLGYVIAFAISPYNIAKHVAIEPKIDTSVDAPTTQYSILGDLEYVKSLYVDDTRLVKKGHFAGIGVQKTETYPKFLIRLWRHKVQLNVPVASYFKHGVGSGQSELFAKGEYSISGTSRDLIELGLKYARDLMQVEEYKEFDFEKVFSIGTSEFASINAKTNEIFGYSLRQNYSQILNFSKTINNTTPHHLIAEWQYRAWIVGYYVEILELGYSVSTQHYSGFVKSGTRFDYHYLGATKTIQSANHWQLETEYTFDILPYIYTGFGRSRLYNLESEDGLFDMQNEIFV